MSLSEAKLSDLPPDAVKLSKQDAIIHQLKIMKSWKNKRDTFIFQYGGTFLGCISAGVGIFLNNHFRRKYKLYDYGRLSSYLPIVVLPAALSLLFHTQFVTTEVTLPNICATCMETRASAIQAMTGCVLPLILAPLSSIPLAMQYHTYDVPFITKEPMKVLKLVQKQTKPIANILTAIFLGQAMIAAVVTYYEMKSVHKVQTKLAKLEFDLEHNQV
ncbi:Transmembrane protein 126 [Popillia japonica]|uniref:Transmembrane protein 126 n=1 Tax=Popillia japonica TaxID=7064 RepID=A0AAW1JI46_POPJA